ncbi:hypothetical protein LX36DRAFT_112366 [Colletotrichum falcatum]|nr:hypothetical protein LX36DRAFT_112366 [Colletotrichum falcatum]
MDHQAEHQSPSRQTSDDSVLNKAALSILYNKIGLIIKRTVCLHRQVLFPTLVCSARSSTDRVECYFPGNVRNNAEREQLFSTKLNHIQRIEKHPPGKASSLRVVLTVTRGKAPEGFTDRSKRGKRHAAKCENDVGRSSQEGTAHRRLCRLWPDNYEVFNGDRMLLHRGRRSIYMFDELNSSRC